MGAGATRSTGGRLRANVVANYLGKLWSVASIYLFVPFYVQMLGVAAYGLIAFHAVALAVLFFADAGLSAAFSRQAARERDAQALLDQLRSTEGLLLGALACGAAAMVIAAPWIATGWLRAGDALPAETAVTCLRLMPLALVPQVAMSLYLGGLMGRQRQVAANAWQAAFTAARAAGVLAPLAWRPEPETYFAWQVLCGWAFLLPLRSALRAEIRGPQRELSGRFSVASLRVIGAYAVGMFAMAVISGLNTQLDRLVVSRLRPLDEFAFYTLAATLAQVPTMITVPVAAALLPRLTQLVDAADASGLRQLYRTGTFTVAVLAGTSAAVTTFFAPELLALWLSGQSLPASLPVVTALLSVGGLLLALQLMPFQLSLAHGHNATNVVLGLATLAVSVPLQLLLTSRFGLVGAAVPWLLVGCVGFAVLGLALNRRFPTVPLSTWFVRLNLLPCAWCFGLLAATRALADRLDATPGVACTMAAAAAVLAGTVAHFWRPRPAGTAARA